ncbi:J domain-containing protein [Sagittula sp. SSi028]|uniref:J domain-containing protein n=1 Tax=Sagittula sp. SSi028 TaxID=3400636 RepID=UPI003AF9F211
MSRKSPSSFEILGVSPWDDYATIRAAYKRLVREAHPDASLFNRPQRSARLAEQNAAFDNLRNHVPLRGPRPDTTKPKPVQTKVRTTQRAQSTPPKRPTAPRSERQVPKTPPLSPQQARALRSAAKGFDTARMATTAPHRPRVERAA